ncbi:hypothetical protein BDZ31_001361 [Conexibacter arvalis]|uniref:Uncharacterized protein n=1 Tax=Conexibacter arvalis TaxID=912552 RepID=A0A840ICK7_9ACTN|nr:hypothetical protein [Conexibacter arvalis]
MSGREAIAHAQRRCHSPARFLGAQLGEEVGVYVDPRGAADRTWDHVTLVAAMSRHSARTNRIRPQHPRYFE